MALPFRPNCLPSMLGPLPYTSPATAWDMCGKYLPALLPLPVLAASGEHPATLAAEGFAGTTLAGDQPRFDRTAAAATLDDLYVAYLKNQWDSRALGLRALSEWATREKDVRRAEALVAVVMGPISTALRLVDAQGLPAIDDEAILDALAKHLALRLQWQQMTVGRSARSLLTWLYEPYLEVVGSPFVSVTWPVTCALLEETFSGFSGARGIWISSVADLEHLLDVTALDVVGFSVAASPPVETWAASLRELLRRKGAIGWGIVPQTAEGIAHARVGRIAARFGELLRELEACDVRPAEVVAASIIMPEDTIGHLEPAQADAVLALTNQVSGLIRHTYGLD